MTAIFGSILSLLAAYRYPLVFATVLVQGPVIMMGTGLLLRLGQFSLWPLYFTLLIADFVGDIIWYFIGRYAAEPFLRRFGHIFGITHKVFEKMEDLFRRHDTKIIFISKITMGFGFALATLMAAGAMRVPLKKYLILNLLGGFIWTGLLVAAGFFLGNVYFQVDRAFRWVFLFAVAVSGLSLFYGFLSFMRRRYNN